MIKTATCSSYLVSFACVLSVGCGGSSVPITSSEVRPSITQQPSSQTIPLSGTATLKVTASGSEPLAYQWSENGYAIAGATSATYTSPGLSLADSGDKFIVTVSNGAGEIVSTPAVVTLGPRSPNPRDLRFKHVGFPQPLTGILHSAIPGSAAGFTYSTYQDDTVGTPLEVGTAGVCAGYVPATGVCTWAYTLFSPPAGTQGFTSFYGSDLLTNLHADLTQVDLMPNAVITTLDEEPPYGVLAYAYEQDLTVPGGFTQTVSTVSPGELQSTLLRLGAQGGVVTAVSAGAPGLLDLISYTWAGAGTESYEAKAVQATSSNVGEQADSLAATGYILTAVGGNGPGDFVLIGTRVFGDSLSRPFAFSSDEGAFGNTNATLAVVGYVYAYNSNVVFGEQ